MSDHITNNFIMINTYYNKMKLTSKSFDRLDSHMSYHNLETLMNNLDIFKTRFTHHKTIKIDNKKLFG